MIRDNSLGSLNSLSLSFDSQNSEEKNAESEDETKKTFHKYEKIGFLKDSVEVKESICTKHYDEQGNKYYNEYKVISFLGSGAFSKIELVEKEGVKYAIKIIDKYFLQSQKNMEFDEEGNIIVNTSFENAIKEIAILKKTSHPNIIKLYEILYCKKNKKIYLILEYCEHGELIDYDEEKGEFKINKNAKEKEKTGKKNELYYSTKQIFKFLKNIVSGLYYLHSNGIIHRDIKPNNILLDKNNVCKITDFNVSSILENLDDDNIERKICSADHFRPPEVCDIPNKLGDKEQINNKKPDLKGKPVDIWALGITAYILSYNKFPFESKTNNIFELYKKINEAKVEFPKFPKRKPILKHFIKKCLEKDPNKRITIECLLRFPFCERNSVENFANWKKNQKINVSKKEIIKCVNFFVPNCCAIFKMGNLLEKKVYNKLFKYRKYKGKTFFLNKMLLYRSIEDKYGVFEVDGLLFRKEDFGIPPEIGEDKYNKMLKAKYFENYKKYEKPKENLKKETFRKYLKNIKYIK